MKKNALIIYNPKAGKNGAAHMLPYVVESLRKRNCRCVAWPTLPGYGCEEILADEEGKFDYIVCCGGDGTLNHAINGLMRLEEKPQLIYLPTGSTNDFAISLGLNKDIETACRKVEDTQPFYYDIGKFNKSYFNYVAAFGAFTQVSYTTSQIMKNQLGHTAYILEGIQELSQIKAHRLRFELPDGRILEDDYLFGAISNSTSVGGVLTLAPSLVDLADGKFELLLVRAPRDLTELHECVLAVQKQVYNCKMITFQSASHIKIYPRSDMPWTLDGEHCNGSAFLYRNFILQFSSTFQCFCKSNFICIFQISSYRNSMCNSCYCYS